MKAALLHLLRVAVDREAAPPGKSEGTEGDGEQSSREGSSPGTGSLAGEEPQSVGREEATTHVNITLETEHVRKHRRSPSWSRAGKQSRSQSRVSKCRAIRYLSRQAKEVLDRQDGGSENPIDYDAPLTWPDSDEEDSPNLQEVLEETKRILKTSCLSKKSNSARLQVRSSYPLPNSSYEVLGLVQLPQARAVHHSEAGGKGADKDSCFHS